MVSSVSLSKELVGFLWCGCKVVVVVVDVVLSAFFFFFVVLAVVVVLLVVLDVVVVVVVVLGFLVVVVVVVEDELDEYEDVSVTSSPFMYSSKVSIASSTCLGGCLRSIPLLLGNP